MASKGQAWTRHCAPAAPAFTRPSLPSQFLLCVTLGAGGGGSGYFRGRGTQATRPHTVFPNLHMPFLET